MTSDNHRINPIVPERDDMIGRSSGSTASSKSSSSKSSGSKYDGGSSGGGSSGGSSNGGGSNKLTLLLLLCVIGGGAFAWFQFDALSKNHAELQQRFNALESRLSSTDASVSQSGAALQLKISKQAEELDKHWSEIKKLWGVTNDINKNKIETNKKDIAFLSGKRAALEKQVADISVRVDKDARSLTNLSGNYLAISADIDAINTESRKLTDKVSGVQSGLTNIDRQIKSQAEAIASMDAFRRQINQKIYDLESKLGISGSPLANKPEEKSLTDDHYSPR